MAWSPKPKFAALGLLTLTGTRVRRWKTSIEIKRTVRSSDAFHGTEHPSEASTLVTATSLKAHTSKDLAQMAKTKGVAGWHSMRKDQLVKALLKIAKQKEKEKNLRSPSRSKSTRGRSGSPKSTESVIAKQIRSERQRRENRKNLAASCELGKRDIVPESDRLILIVRDAFWMQAYWEITRATVQRAKVALSGYWHTAKPILRLLEISSDGNTNSVENIAQEIDIHSGVNNWYINCPKPCLLYTSDAADEG